MPRETFTPATAADSGVTLMRACSLLFLFRSLGELPEPSAHESARSVEAQILRLMGDLAGVPDASGFILLGKGEAELLAAAGERRLDTALIARACRDGAVPGAVPLYVRESVEGVIAANLPNDLLAAVGTLASAALEAAREIAGLKVQKALLEESLPSFVPGGNPAMLKLLHMVDRLAPQDVTVLILGESGTGKELVARTLHSRSRRSDAPFVAINCATLSPNLLESELFGHEKGAFTDASTQKKGKLELAGAGTVFLDEIGELAAELQAKLLRVLQQREFERVGGTRTLRLEARVVAATNRDLAAEVRRGAFREDLYHRLNVVALRTLPLRERREDILPLARHFAAAASARCGRRVTAVSAEAARYLEDYSWPGNVRELENAMERAAVLGESETILPEDLPESVLEAAAAPKPAGGYQASVGDAKRDSILQAWAEAGGDYKLASQRLGLHPNSLLRLVRNLGLRDALKS